jgi:hypothetical protein
VKRCRERQTEMSDVQLKTVVPNWKVRQDTLQPGELYFGHGASMRLHEQSYQGGPGVRGGDGSTYPVAWAVIPKVPCIPTTRVR